MQRLTVFEHDTLSVGPTVTAKHVQALLRYAERSGHRFLTPVYQGVRLNSWVGSVQVGDLQLEILPKTGRQGHAELWRKALPDLLRACRLLPVKQAEALQAPTPGTLPEQYAQHYLSILEQLWAQGLRRHYQAEEGNLPFWRGKVVMRQQLRQNYLHQERCYTRHTRYAIDHPVHQLLYQALEALASWPLAASLQVQRRRLRQEWPITTPLPDATARAEQLIKTAWNDTYRQALVLARLILTHTRVDGQGGPDHVHALLFDMNRLFEEYVYRQLKAHETEALRITRQCSRLFWETRSIRPDILIEAGDQRWVLDTKWKTSRRGQPDDDDLKQMYVYTHYYGADCAVLLYPQTNEASDFHGSYHRTPRLSASDRPHACRVQFAALLRHGSLNPHLGRELLQGMLADSPIARLV
ncbi:5-methylcytosine-specific restriction enzyme subunit McrC [Catalinimonas alkaloidigena]|uniref:5-methylcytosine-specific restriction enzyme subunit McrC n=1 Tax=Catalinimonas alkaloidigena TaxID=1075417 RepID=A0A1G9F7J3_9BACT|nr:hypothetical protein [Catalinimonas alkaloidigena]SDK84305.1 5-methylcytosine-specific restriction enzyme subunit McrC [Catalinimonas alkaloidigena]